MTASIEAKSNGTQGSLKVNGADAVVFDSTGIVSGVNKSAVTQMPTLGTAVATTSGTAVDFTGIPSWANKITLMLRAVSTNGASNYLVRIGAGSIDTTGYVSACAYGTSTTIDTVGFVIANGVAASDLCSGRVTLYRISGNIWVQDGIVSSNVVRSSSGDKSLSGTLDRLRLTTVNGTDTFDAGSINILYE